MIRREPELLSRDDQSTAPARIPAGSADAPCQPPPRWARAADWLTAAFALIAAVIAVSGGFRTRMGGVRLTVTSPLRLLVAAVAIGLLRHYLHRATPIHRHLGARIAAWARRPETRTALAVVVGTRPAILFVGYLAVFLFGYAQGTAPLRVSDNELINLPVRWDAGWYLQIVIEGYKYVADQPALQQNIVFFPAYPALVRVVGLLFGNRELSYVLAAVCVSFAAWFGALVYLYRLARDFCTDDEARYALWLLGAYPFALFFGGIYTESLFLLGACGAFYHFTRRELWRAAAWGFLVGLTRPNGAFLAVSLGLLAVAPALPGVVAGGPRRSTAPDSLRNAGRRLLDMPALAAAAAPVAGTLVYSTYVWWLSGDPLTWAAGHLAWGRQYKGLGALISDRYDFIWRAGLYTYVAMLPHDLLNALGAIFVLIAAWPVYRRIGFAYAVFILINILPPLAAGGLLSAGRFSSVLFPAFIWLACWVSPRHRAGWIASFAAIQALDAMLFYTWRPLY